MLGSFWRDFFSEDGFINAVSETQEVLHRQIVQDMHEMRRSLSVSDAPLHHTERWVRVQLSQQHGTDGFVPVLYGEGFVYGPSVGKAPLYDFVPEYGGNTHHPTLQPSDIPRPRGILALSDNIKNPSVVLFNHVDFVFDDMGRVVFITRNPFYVERIRELIEIDYETQTDTINLFGYHVTFDLDVLTEQWGYLLGYRSEVTPEYRQVLATLCKGRIHGFSYKDFLSVLSAEFRTPCTVSDSETVEVVYEKAGRHTIVTDKRVYRLPEGDTPAVEVGDTLPQGTFVGNRISALYPANMPAMQENAINTIPDVSDIDAVASTQVIVYLVIETSSSILDVPALERASGLAAVFEGGGAYQFTIDSLHVFSPRRIFVRVVPHLVLGDAFKTGEVTFLDPDGNQVLDTGTMLLQGAKVWLYQHVDHATDMWGEQINEKIDDLRGVAIIGLLPDIDPFIVRSFFEDLRFHDGFRLGVDVILSTHLLAGDFYGEAGDGVSTSALGGYQAVLVDTAGGVYTTTSPIKGVLSKVSDSDSIVDYARVRQRLEFEVAGLEKEMADLDGQLAWLIAQCTGGDPYDLHEILGIAGVLGSPNSPTDPFYSQGAFGRFAPDEVSDAISRNQFQHPVFKVMPEDELMRETLPGRSVEETLVPEESQVVRISSDQYEEVFTIDPDKRYVYRVTDVTET